MRRPTLPTCTLLEILGGAAFTGFEGALLFIALESLFSSDSISIGLWGMSLGGLIFGQYRRIIEKIDLPIIAGITLGLVLLLSFLRSFPSEIVVVISILGGAGAIAATALFLLIYRLLSRFS